MEDVLINYLPSIKGISCWLLATGADRFYKLRPVFQVMQSALHQTVRLFDREAPQLLQLLLSRIPNPWNRVGQHLKELGAQKAFQILAVYVPAES